MKTSQAQTKDAREITSLKYLIEVQASYDGRLGGPSVVYELEKDWIGDLFDGNRKLIRQRFTCARLDKSTLSIMRITGPGNIAADLAVYRKATPSLQALYSLRTLEDLHETLGDSHALSTATSDADGTHFNGSWAFFSVIESERLLLTSISAAIVSNDSNAGDVNNDDIDINVQQCILRPGIKSQRNDSEHHALLNDSDYSTTGNDEFAEFLKDIEYSYYRSPYDYKKLLYSIRRAPSRKTITKLVAAISTQEIYAKFLRDFFDIKEFPDWEFNTRILAIFYCIDGVDESTSREDLVFLQSIFLVLCDNSIDSSPDSLGGKNGKTELRNKLSEFDFTKMTNAEFKSLLQKIAMSMLSAHVKDP